MSMDLPTPVTKFSNQELYRIIVQLSQDVKQATKEVRELMEMLRGDNLNTGLILEHERIKEKIDYANIRSIDDRLCEVERIVAAGKWIAVLVIGSGLLNLIQFVWSLIMHESQVIHP